MPTLRTIRCTIVALAMLSSSFFAGTAHAAPAGAFDPSFGIGGIFTMKPPARGMTGVNGVLLPDGEAAMLVESTFGDEVMWLDADGRLDVRKGRVGLTDVPTTGQAMRVRADGSLMIAGGGTAVRVDRRGQLDGSYGDHGVATMPEPASCRRQCYPVAAEIDRDGGTLIAMAPPYDRSARQAAVMVVRITPSGRVDRRFGDRGVVRTRQWDDTDADQPSVFLATQDDGRWLIAGAASDDRSGLRVSRFRSDGSIDKSYASHGSLFMPSSETQEWLLYRMVLDSRSRAVLVAGRMVMADSVDSMAMIILDSHGHRATDVHHGLPVELGIGRPAAVDASGDHIDVYSSDDRSAYEAIGLDGERLASSTSGSNGGWRSVVVRVLHGAASDFLVTSDARLVATPSGAAPHLPPVDSPNAASAIARDGLGSVEGVFARSDGRTLVVGGSGTQDFWMAPRPNLVLTMLRRNGTLDPMFGTGGVVRIDLPDEARVGEVIELADQSLLVTVQLYKDEDWHAPLDFLIKVGASGAVDSKFGIEGRRAISGMSLSDPFELSDGNLGVLAHRPEEWWSELVRMDRTGAELSRTPLKTDLVPRNDWLMGVVPGPGGAVDVLSDLGVTRLGPDGRRDESYGAAGFVSVPDAMAMVRTRDGGAIVTTGSTKEQVSMQLTRLTADGQLEAGFGIAGSVTSPKPTWVADFGTHIQELGDGSIVRVVPISCDYRGGSCSASNRDVVVERFTSDGGVDRPFGRDGLLRFSLPGGAFADLAGPHVLATEDRLIIGTGVERCLSDERYMVMSISMHTSAGSRLPSSLQATSGDDELDGGWGCDTIDGGSGDDTIVGGDDDDTIRGGEGDDRLAGDMGDDMLDGGSGDDRLAGGAGADRIYGGRGRDRIVASDRKRDRVDCGSGWDVAIVDRKDVVHGCERVYRR